MHRYAQTNLQLYAQLGAAGWSDSALEQAGRAYELAIELCGASVRPNGKPFLCHLAGTASIVASWDAPPHEVAGALVHSVYTHGDFGGGTPGLVEVNRARVRAAIGAEREELIAAYTRQPWTPEAIDELAGRRSSLGVAERSVVRIRLANELEDYLDLGLRYARKAKPAGIVDGRDARLVLAEDLVGSGFAAELGAAITQTAETDVPEALVREATRSGGVGPASRESAIRRAVTRATRRLR